MSYEEIINCGIPFRCDIFLGGGDLINFVPNKKLGEKFKDRMYFIIKKKFDNILGNISIKLRLALVVTDDNNKRVIKYSIISFYNDMMKYLDLSDKTEDIVVGKLTINKEYVINSLKVELKKKKELLVQAKCVEDIKKVSISLYEEYISLGPIIEDPIRFKEEKKRDIEAFSKTIINIKYFIDELDKPLPYDILDGIDKDKLQLFLAHTYFEMVKTFKTDDDTLCLLILDYVYKTLEKLKGKGMIELKNIFLAEFGSDTKQLHNSFYSSFTNLDLSVKVMKFLEENKDISEAFKNIQKYDATSFSNYTIKEIEEYIDTLIEDIKGNWQKVDANELENDIFTLTEKAKTVSEEEKNKILILIKKIRFLMSNKPIQIIKGEGTFEDYYGYIYPNGKVILEKLYDDKIKETIAYGEAIYIMNIDDFKKYSKLKKKELMTLILLNSNKDLGRIIHNDNWEERLYDIINSGIKNSTDLSIDYLSVDINSLVSDEELENYINLLEKLNEMNIDSKEELKEQVIKAKKKKIKNVLKKLEKMLLDKPSCEDATIKENKDFDSIVNEIFGSINKDSFIDFFTEFFKNIEINTELNNKISRVRRNPAVAAYTKKRSNCHCDLCNDEYAVVSLFESHHFIPLAEGGPDNIYNTVCLCPRCHKIAHTTGFTDREKYILISKIGEYLKRDKIPEEYIEKYNELFKNFEGIMQQEEFHHSLNGYKRN